MYFKVVVLPGAGNFSISIILEFVYFRDVLCGLLHCSHQNEKLSFWKDALTYTMPESFLLFENRRYACKAVILDVGLDMPDPGMVPNGAKCGEDKVRTPLLNPCVNGDLFDKYCLD